MRVGFGASEVVMARLGMSLVIVGVMLGVGCNSSDRRVVSGDAGGGRSDAGGGGGSDAGSGGGSDAGGGGGSDAGGGGGCEIPADLGALPAACLPRCSASTLTAFMACTTAACQQTAAMADTTPPITVGGSAFTCANCVNYGNNSCYAASCPTEFDAYLTCSAMMGATCTAEVSAVNACVMAHMTVVQTCVNERVTACFPAG